MNSGKDHAIKAAKLFIAAVLVGMSLLSLYMLWERAPEVSADAPSVPVPAEAAEPEEETVQAAAVASPVLPTATPEPASGRQKGVYTILMVGNDDGNGNTDTLVVGRIDTVRHKMDFVNIPRDTLVNIDWSIRKINAVYWGDINSGGNGIDRLKAQVEDLIGFPVDCYAVIDLDVLEAVVDAMGGVTFQVPMAMDYDDETQNLHIHIQEGEQLLNGEQALGVCRYRSGYPDGDLGRIRTQQSFLKACIGQFIEKGSIPNLTRVVDILASGLHTDLTAANIAYFLRQALRCDREDVCFHTLPTEDGWVAGLSYTIVDLDAWLPLLNACLNPYRQQITRSNVDIVYRENGVFTGTAGLKGPEYYQNA